MNQVALIGRLTKNVELKTTQSGVSVCQFNIAVERRFKTEGQPTADFIPVVAWKQTADFISKYFHKGNKIALLGRIQTRSWESEGKKYFTTEIIAENVEFCESKKQNENNFATTEAGYFDNDNYFPLNEDDDVPF